MELNVNAIFEIENQSINKVIGMDNPYNYRNKGQYPVSEDPEGKVKIGFYKSKTHTIVDVDECFIQNEKNNEIIKTVRELITECGTSIYNEFLHKGSYKTYNVTKFKIKKA